MIYIKRNIILFGIIVSMIVLAFLSTPKKQKPLEDIVQQELDVETMQGEEADETESDFQLFAQKEDPVREFFSEGLKQAADFFFSNEINVVAIGDSLTAGSGDETENGGYVGVLDETINDDKQIVDFTNHGKPGNRSSQLIERLEEKHIQKSIKQAHIVLITIGANDIMHVFKNNFTDLSTIDPFTSEQIRYEQRLETILSMIQEMNEDTEIYLIGFYNPFKAYFSDIEELDYIVDSWNTIGETVAGQFDNGHFIPMVDVFDDVHDIYLADDNFHPNYFGYQLMAERILQSVMNESGVVDDKSEE